MRKSVTLPDTDHLVTLLLPLMIVAYGVLSILSEGTHGGADEISHYYFSRYAFKFPSFFLDLWAKPVFTALSAPFAQLGYQGFRIFNVVAGSAAAWLTYRCARLLGWRVPLTALFLVLSSPLYVVMMLSGMTEILFSLVLIASVTLFLRNRTGWSALLLSFLPFVRIEGVVILPLFLAALVLERQWRAVPWLLFGTLFYSVAGSFHYRDPLWLWHEMPYTGEAVALYGSGDLFHFPEASKFIFGLPLALLLLLGIVAQVIEVWQGRNGPRDQRRKRWTEALVITLPFLAYFAAHSILWWRGWGNSLGLIRVMAAVVPLAALLGARAWDRAAAILRLPGPAMRVLTGILCLLLLAVPLTIYTLPVPLRGEQKMVREVSRWLREAGYTDAKIHYFDPFFPYYLGKNPFEKEAMHLHVYDPADPGKNIEAGELVLWDAHFGPNEGGVPLSALTDHPGYRLIRRFTPDPPFRTLGGGEYGIYVFQRVNEFDIFKDP